jgi:hypothetical protein
MYLNVVLLILSLNLLAPQSTRALGLRIPHSDLNLLHFLPWKQVRDVDSVRAVLQSATRLSMISVPLDGSPYTISSLLPPFAADDIEGQQYDSIRLLGDTRCLFTTINNNMLVLGGGLPTVMTLGPPQAIWDVTCAADLVGKK